MPRCETRSGVHQCMHTIDANGRHEGDCEAQAREYAIAFPEVWWDACKVHGLTEHHKIGGCIACQKAKTHA